MVPCVGPHKICPLDPCSSEGHGYTERRLSQKILKENLVVNKTANRFSAIAIDQRNEHTAVKDDGGAVGFTENPAALRKEKEARSMTS